jgi:hypothetical protein
MAEPSSNLSSLMKTALTGKVSAVSFLARLRFSCPNRNLPELATTTPFQSE